LRLRSQLPQPIFVGHLFPAHLEIGHLFPESNISVLSINMNFQACLSSMGSLLSGKGLDRGSQMTSMNVGILFVALICIIAPLELSQLGFALIGALAYAVLQAFSPKSRKTNCQLTAERDEHELVARTGRKQYVKGLGASATRQRQGSSTRAPHSPTVSPVVKADVYQPSSVPVFAPKFESIGWEAEVNELVSQLAPGADEDQAVQRLVLHVKQTIQVLFPEVEVSGFAHGSLKCGKAFGVAVPEVEIVANVNPVVLAQRLQQRSQQVDVKKLQKSAIRTCTDRLVAHGGLKFRRSAFRGEEPRVTLLVPASSGFFTDAIPVDFSINAVTPFYTAALLTECGQIEPRAKALILLVKRWAKDRGICHAAKGHFSPYIWSLLVIYFLQVGVDEEGSLLPTLDSFKISSINSKRRVSLPSLPCPISSDGADNLTKLSIGQLFCKFVRFYNQHFSWTSEAVSIRLGKRAPPGLSLPLHVIPGEGGIRHEQGLAIEDPFKAANNLGTCMNAMSSRRFHEELRRADRLCERGASLTEVLEPWVPTEEPIERSSSSASGEQDESINKDFHAFTALELHSLGTSQKAPTK